MTRTTHGAGELESVRAARDAYLEENGFTIEEYTATTFRLEILGRERVLPNPPNRRWAIPLHDLHHVATGYGTDFVGEGEIGAWELGAGCVTPVVYVLNAIAASIAFLLAPVRVVRAFRHGLASRSLYRLGLDREAVLDGTVAELRRALGVPPGGLARGPRRLHAAAEEARARRAGRAEALPKAPG